MGQLQGETQRTESAAWSYRITNFHTGVHEINYTFSHQRVVLQCFVNETS